MAIYNTDAPTNQVTPGRIPGMIQAIREFNQPINMLEIGTWCAEGSTRIWFDELKPGSSLTLLDYWRPFCSNDYENRNFNYKSMDHSVNDAFIKTFKRVVNFEKTYGDKIKINIIRADSKTYLSNFKDKTFDFIYIDGSHHYDNVKIDIQESKRIIKPYGIISGDDYEHDMTFKLPNGDAAFPKFLEEAKKHPNKDFISIPNTKYSIHPGVLLAIHEEFDSKVLNNDGFWKVYSNNNKFNTEKPNKFNTIYGNV